MTETSPTQQPEQPKIAEFADVQTMKQLDAREILGSPEFKAWAGESWQEGGEVVTDGEVPAIFYHGGNAGVSQFSAADGPNTSAEQTGIYFTPRIQDARFYAGKLQIDQSDRGLPQDSSVYAVMLKVKQPYETAKGDEIASQTALTAPEGFDGIVNPRSQEVVVFNPDQVFIVGEVKMPSHTAQPAVAA